MQESTNHIGSFLILLVLRSLAAAMYLGCVYFLVTFMSVFFSGETGTELLVFAVPLLLLMNGAVASVATIFVYLTYWNRLPLKRSLTSQKRVKTAIILPTIFGAAIAATTIIYFPMEEDLNQNDRAKAELMYGIVIDLLSLEELPQTLSELDDSKEYAEAGISYELAPPDYRLCAIFEQDTREMYEGDDGENRPGGINFYKHPVGYHCFTISPETD